MKGHGIIGADGQGRAGTGDGDVRGSIGAGGDGTGLGIGIVEAFVVGEGDVVLAGFGEGEFCGQCGRVRLVRIGKQWEGGGAGAGVIDGKGGGFYGFGGFEDKADLGSHQGVDDAFGRRFGAGESWA